MFCRLPELFEIGVLNGHSLVMLEQVITNVYIPLLAYNQHKNNNADSKPTAGSPTSGKLTRENTTAGSENEPVENQQSNILRDEFLINMKKFAHSIRRTIQQIEGEVRLEIPDITLPGKI